jgi:hypothetical protein
MTPGTPDLYSREEAARILEVCIRTVDNYISQGHLKVVYKPRHGRRMGTYIAPAEIERFQDRLAAKAAKAK